MKMRRALPPLLLLAAALLTGCGGDDSGGSRADDDAGSSATSSTAAADDVGACDLMSAQDVAAAVGAPVKEGVGSGGAPVTGGAFSTCVWQSDDPANPADTATLTVYSNTAAADSAREDDSQELEGIGDKAFSASVSSVWAYVGDRSFFAQWYAFGTTDDQGLEQSTALAKAVAEKL